MRLARVLTVAIVVVLLVGYDSEGSPTVTSRRVRSHPTPTPASATPTPPPSASPAPTSRPQPPVPAITDSPDLPVSSPEPTVSMIESGKAYWRMVGQPAFPEIRETSANNCSEHATGCQTWERWERKETTREDGLLIITLEPSGACLVWFHPDADEDIAAHEIGHCLGFDHDNSYGGVMHERSPNITASVIAADRSLCRREPSCGGTEGRTS